MLGSPFIPSSPGRRQGAAKDFYLNVDLENVQFREAPCGFSGRPRRSVLMMRKEGNDCHNVNSIRHIP